MARAACSVHPAGIVHRMPAEESPSAATRATAIESVRSVRNVESAMRVLGPDCGFGFGFGLSVFIAMRGMVARSSARVSALERVGDFEEELPVLPLVGVEVAQRAVVAVAEKRHGLPVELVGEEQRAGPRALS